MKAIRHAIGQLNNPVPLFHEGNACDICLATTLVETSFLLHVLLFSLYQLWYLAREAKCNNCTCKESLKKKAKKGHLKQIR